MKLIGNIIWVLFGGVLMALEYLLLGLLWCVTIIGIPVGLQLFKCASLALWPFGREVRPKEHASGCLSVGLNIVWVVLGGLLMAIEHALLGLVFCITIVGIPFGLQHFKLAGIALTPFGHEIGSIQKSETTEAVRTGSNIVSTSGNIVQPDARQKMLIGGGVLAALIVVLALVLGLRGCSDSATETDLLLARPVVWHRFVAPRAASAPIYSEPDISHMMLKANDSNILPVTDETENFFKVYLGSGKEAWVKKSQWDYVATAPIDNDRLEELFLEGQRLNSRMITVNKGRWQGLVLCFYRDFSAGYHLELGIMDEGRLVRPIYASMKAMPLNERGLKIIPSVGGSQPQVEYGTNYQTEGGELDLEELSEREILEIWQAAQGGQPQQVMVWYNFPERNLMRPYDLDLTVYGMERVLSQGVRAAEGNAGLSGFTYIVESDEDQEQEMTFFTLYAVTPDGKKVETGFGHAPKLNVLTQGDWDSDGELECVVYEWSGGNLLAAPYLVRYDQEANEFKKVEGFDIISENPDIKAEDWNGKPSLVVTVGLRKDRYTYTDNKLEMVERNVPDVGKIIATVSITQLFSTDSENEEKPVYIDIDGDGSTEKLIFYHDTSHALNWGNEMRLQRIEADGWRLPEAEGETLGISAATFSFIEPQGGHAPNILCDEAWLYKWDGSSYTKTKE